MIDFSGGVVPGKEGVLGAQPSKGDEVFGLGNVDWLPVNSRRHADYSPEVVAEGNSVHCLLDGGEVA